MTTHLAMFTQKFCDTAKITRETECGLPVASLPETDSVIVENVGDGRLPKYDCEACRKAETKGLAEMSALLAKHARRS